MIDAGATIEWNFARALAMSGKAVTVGLTKSLQVAMILWVIGCGRVNS